MKLVDYLAIIRRQRWVLLGAISLGLLFGGLLWALLPVQFDAVASVVVRTEINSRTFPTVAIGSDEPFLRSPDAEVEYAGSESFQRAMDDLLVPDAEVEVRLPTADETNVANSSRIQFVGSAGSEIEAQEIANLAAQLYLERRYQESLSEADRSIDSLATRISLLTEQRDAILVPLGPIDAALERAVDADQISRLTTQRLAIQQRLSDELAPVQSELTLLNRALGEANSMRVLLDVEDISARLSVAADETSSRGPGLPLMLVSFGLIGAIAGYLAALFKDAIQDRLSTKADVASVTSTPVVAELPLIDDSDVVELLSTTGHPYREAIDRLVTYLGLISGGSGASRVLVTSPSEADGKSTIVANLALRLADGGVSTVAVEADLRRPSLTKKLTSSQEALPGLSDIVLDGANIDSVLIHPHPGKPLSVLPSGRSTDQIAGMLRSDELVSTVEDLARSHRMVLLDSPPVLPVADAQALAAIATDYVLLVVRAGATTRSELVEVLERLDQASARPNGIILNGSDLQRSSYYTY